MSTTTPKPKTKRGLIAVGLCDDPRAEWIGMPAFEHEDQRAVRSIRVDFTSLADVAEFARRLGVETTPKTKQVWFPPREYKGYGECGIDLDKRIAAGPRSEVSDLRRHEGSLADGPQADV